MFPDICNSSNPVYQLDGNSASDFNFWDDQIRKGYETCEEDDYTAYSPPLWSRNAAEGGTYSLLQYNHHSNSNLSPTRTTSETALNVPELSIDLSLRDIVDGDELTSHDLSQKKMLEIARIQNNPKPKKRVQISRSESMDSGVFLLKMFLPTCLSSNKSRVARSPSHDGFFKAVNTVWWKIGLLSESKSRSSSSSSRRSAGSIRSSSSSRRKDEMNVKPGCWAFNKPIRQSVSGCLLFSK